MRISTSHKIPNNTDPNYPYISVTYLCKHAGMPRSRGALKRPNQKYFAQNCPAMLKVAYYRVPRVYKVSKLCADHNHPIGESYYNLYPERRRLSGDELMDVKELFGYKIGSRRLAQLIHEKTGKQLTSHDISNIRHRYKLDKPVVPPKCSDTHIMSNELLALQQTGMDLHVETNCEDDEWEFLILQTTVMKDLMKRYGQTLFIVRRDDTNEEGMPLYTILCKNDDNRVCPTGFIFTRGDNIPLLQNALSKFSLTNPQLGECTWLLTTKEVYDSHILQMMFNNANVCLCPWHMMSHVREQFNNYKVQPSKKARTSTLVENLQQAQTPEEYNRCLVDLKSSVSEDLFEEFLNTWDSCRSAWAAAFCPCILTLGSYQMTGFYQKLKRFTKPTFRFMETVKSLIDFCKQNDVILAHVSFKKLKSTSQDKKIDLFQRTVSKMCTDEAINFIQNQIELYSTGKWEIDVTHNSVTDLMTNEQFFIGPGKLSCSCLFQIQHQLPCCHLIVFRDTLGMELGLHKLIHDKWKKSVADTDVDMDDDPSDVPDSDNPECNRSGFNISLPSSISNGIQLEKFCEAQVVTNKVALFLSKCVGTDFDNKIACLKNLLHSWEKRDQIILCTVKSTEMPAAMIEDHCYLLSNSTRPKQETIVVKNHVTPEIDLSCPVVLDTVEEVVGT